MEKEYLIIGDNNFWYAICETLKEAKAQIRKIKKDGNSGYGCAICSEEPCCKPDNLYIYEAKEITE